MEQRPAPLTVELPDDCTIVVRRRFSAPPEDVFRAHVEADLMKRWMNGADSDWRIVKCISEARPGGEIAIYWESGTEGAFHLLGQYLEVEAPHRILHTETMYFPDPAPENRVETRIEPDGSGTQLTVTMTLPDKTARDAIIEGGQTEGMEQCYAALEVLEVPAT